MKELKNSHDKLRNAVDEVQRKPDAVTARTDEAEGRISEKEDKITDKDETEKKIKKQIVQTQLSSCLPLGRMKAGVASIIAVGTPHFTSSFP